MHRLADRTDFGRLNRSERKAPLKLSEERSNSGGSDIL
jgi:hypothetical protein